VSLSEPQAATSARLRITEITARRADTVGEV